MVQAVQHLATLPATVVDSRDNDVEPSDLCTCNGTHCVLNAYEHDLVFNTWRNRALACLPLDAVYGDMRASGEGWITCLDPFEGPDSGRLARVADDGVDRGTMERADGRRVSAAYVLAATRELDDLESGWVLVADLAGVPMPSRFNAWVERFRDVQARRFLKRFTATARRYPGRAIRETLEDKDGLARLGWLVHSDRGRYERLGLFLRDAGARSYEVSALQRASRAESKLRFSGFPVRRQHMPIAIDEVALATEALELVYTWACANKHTFWSRDTHAAFADTRASWSGRWDDRDWSYLGFEPAVLREILDTAGLRYTKTLTVWKRAGWVLIDSSGNPRWQVRVGASGARRWLLAIKRQALVALGDGTRPAVAIDQRVVCGSA